MSKTNETRMFDYYGWQSRTYFTDCIMTHMVGEWMCIDEINTLIKEADELLAGHSEISRIWYADQTAKIDEMNEGYSAYITYIDALYYDIYEIDHDFFADIKSNAVELLSNVKSDQYSVQKGELAGKYGGITLEDFAVGERTIYGGGETYELELTELEDFSKFISDTYGELAEQNGISVTDYCLMMFQNGEFDHTGYHPVKDFLSGLVDVASLGIVPLIEACAGKDFITGETLSDKEIQEKGIEAVLGILSIALIPVTGGGSMTLKTFGAEVLKESISGVAGYVIYEGGETLDLPTGVNMALSMAGTVAVYKTVDGCILKIGKSAGVGKADDALKVGSKTIQYIDGFENYSSEVKKVMNSWKEADISSFNKLTLEEKNIYIKAIQNEGNITPELQEIVIKNGGYLDGLEYRIKSPSSVFEKVYLRPETTPILEMHDIVRYTEIQAAENLVATTQKTIADLESRGYEIIKLKNTWIDDINPYNGINAQVKSPEGQIFELQFHTPESFTLKNSEEMHGLYECQRVLDVDDIEYFEIQDKMFELSDSLTIPKDIETLENIK